MPGGIKRDEMTAAIQIAHTLGLCLYSYANDNQGNYPDGKSSTEVFQKLLDEGYVSDPTIFYVAMAGKIKPVRGVKLKPENVCWDLTVPADSTSPDELPLVFLTGYKISYAPGAAAVPLVKPFPRFGSDDPDQTFVDWFLGRHTIHWAEFGGIVVEYKNNMSKFMKRGSSGGSNVTVANFISPEFKSDGRTYRQLTPGGVLP